MTSTAIADTATPRPLPYPEFIALIALNMSLTALAVDVMLPALPAIGEALGVVNPNHRQVVVTSYLLGFAVGHFIYGPISDRFGRRGPLLVGLSVGVAASFFCVYATSFDGLLAARVVQGLGFAASRVIATAIVRDCYSGRQMAQVMSLLMSIFIIVPVVAPGIGEVLMALGDWTWTFYAVLFNAMILLVWSALRLTETRAPEHRLPLSVARLGGAFGQILANRRTLGYGVASGILLGVMMGYINSAQQIFVGIYDLGHLFPVAFGAVVLTMSLASFINGRLVGRHGMRRLSHSATLIYIAAGCGFALIAAVGSPPLHVFLLFMGGLSFLFGLMMSNFNAIAMEPQGRIAGTASSFLGAFSIGCGATLGWVIGQAYDDTVLPLAIGAVVLGASALLAILFAERGRLFAHHDD
jgi:DHA1 family bicyclomycin/chloramphenicol resistance-like MFS transporter